MPYIITTTQSLETDVQGATDTATAVATLDETRAAAKVVIDNLPPDHSDRDWSEHYAAAMLSESGGTIGPLPDGTVLEVRHVSWPELGEAAGRPYRFAEYEQTVDAFNARG